MRRQILTALFSALMLAACSESNLNQFSADKSDSGIVGGAEVQVGDIKASSVVMIYGEKESGESYICTGTFISEDIVLTAAHCVVENISTMSLIFGSKPFAEVSPSMSVKAIKIHEKYHANQKHDRNDIALIFFGGGLPTGAKVAPLLEFGDVPLALESYGYGRTEGNEDSDKASDELGILRKVALNGGYVSPSDDGILELDQSGGQGVCYGDSGGPLFSAKGEIVGVASAVEGDEGSSDSCSFKSYFTSVVSYRDWIITYAKLH